MKYNRILLKLSGEALMGKEGFGIDPDIVREVTAEIAEIRKLGVQVAIVVGGGNIYRGMRAEKQGIDRTTGDYMGMVATLMNALILQEVFEKGGQSARVQSALAVEKIAEPYGRAKALQYLEEGKVVIFACGTGSPYFTTDTAAALRALETGADALLKATKVEGVYDRDPELYPDATFFPEISYADALRMGVKVMDATAIALCMENNVPIIVFNLRGKNNMKKVVLGDPIGTIVRRNG